MNRKLIFLSLTLTIFLTSSSVAQNSFSNRARQHQNAVSKSRQAFYAAIEEANKRKFNNRMEKQRRRDMRNNYKSSALRTSILGGLIKIKTSSSGEEVGFVKEIKNTKVFVSIDGETKAYKRTEFDESCDEFLQCFKRMQNMAPQNIQKFLTTLNSKKDKFPLVTFKQNRDDKELELEKFELKLDDYVQNPGTLQSWIGKIVAIEDGLYKVRVTWVDKDSKFVEHIKRGQEVELEFVHMRLVTYQSGEARNTAAFK